MLAEDRDGVDGMYKDVTEERNAEDARLARVDDGLISERPDSGGVE